MILNNIKTRQKDSGFTIVELLVVIVVIGILAAITIVSYTGITARANLSAAQQSANNTLAKANAYNAEGLASAYPATLSVMTTAASSASYYLTGSVYAAQGTVNTNTTVPAASPTAPASSHPSLA